MGGTNPTDERGSRKASHAAAEIVLWVLGIPFGLLVAQLIAIAIGISTARVSGTLREVIGIEAAMGTMCLIVYLAVVGLRLRDRWRLKTDEVDSSVANANAPNTLTKRIRQSAEMTLLALVVVGFTLGIWVPLLKLTIGFFISRPN